MAFENYEYELILCRADENRTQLAYIKYSALEFSPRFRDIAELRFTIDYFEPTPIGSQVNVDFASVLGSHLVLMNIKESNSINSNIIESKYFYIANPTLNGVDKDNKELVCFSLEYKLARRKLRGYKKVAYLYDTNGSNGILNYMISQMYGVWTVGSIDSSLLNQQRSFNYASTSYIEVFRDIERIFGAFCEFDSINMKINISLLENVGEDTDIFISQDNYMSKLSKSEKHDQIITKLYVYGGNNLSIIDKNITGLPYLLDLSYFRNNTYMNDDLLTAWDTYDAKVKTKQGQYSTYLSQLATYDTSLLTKQSELNSFKITLLEYQDNENTCIKEGTAFGYDYSYWHNQVISQQNLITNKNSEISSVQTYINAVNANIQVLNSELLLENNFTSAQLKVISEYIFEDEMTISEITDSQTLYNEAVYQLNKRKVPIIDFNIDVVDLLSISDCKTDWSKIKVGNYLNIDYKKYGIDCLPCRLIQYTHDPLNNKLTFNFNNQDEYNSDFYYNNRIAQKAAQTSNIVEVERPNYNGYSEDKSNILFSGTTINSSDTNITLPDGSRIGNNGLQLTDSLDANYQMRVLGSRLLFTKDNWVTVSVGIDGAGVHAIDIDGVNITGSVITGTIIKTSPTGSRIELGENVLNTYNPSGNLHGFSITKPTSDGNQNMVEFFNNGTKTLFFYNDGENGYIIAPENGAPLTFGHNLATIRCDGSWDFSSANVSGINTIPNLPTYTVGSLPTTGSNIAIIKVASSPDYYILGFRVGSNWYDYSGSSIS